MRTGNRFVPAALVVVSALGLVACQNQKKEASAPTKAASEATASPGASSAPESEELKKENAALKESVGEKTALLNQVQDELEALAKTGEVAASAKQQLEGGVKTRAQSDVLRENITKAKKLLEERSAKIKALQKKLAATEARMGSSEAQLKQMTDLLTKLLIERSNEIAELDAEIAKLRGEKQVVEAERDEAKKGREEESAKRVEAEKELDTGYIAIGTEKDLRARGILSVENKGVLGMKKRIGLAPVKSYEPFQKISIGKDTEIALGKGVKTFEAASGHDLKQCSVEKRDDETFLHVGEPKTFWREKVLVIVVSK